MADVIWALVGLVWVRLALARLRGNVLRLTGTARLGLVRLD